MFPRLATLLTAVVLLATPALAHPGTQTGVAEAREAVKGAEQDVSDANAYLADLQKGDFAGIYGVGENGAIRCGETEANPACTPLTEADKAQAVAEAKEMVSTAQAELNDAQVQLAQAGGGKAAPVQTASYTP